MCVHFFFCYSHIIIDDVFSVESSSVFASSQLSEATLKNSSILTSSQASDTTIRSKQSTAKLRDRRKSKRKESVVILQDKEQVKELLRKHCPIWLYVYVGFLDYPEFVIGVNAYHRRRNMFETMGHRDHFCPDQIFCSRPPIKTLDIHLHICCVAYPSHGII